MIKTAFITGISGQDGSLLAEFLLRKGYKVHGLIKETSSKKNLEEIINNPNLQIIHGDLLNNDLICFILQNYQFNEIYNLASQSNVRLSYDNPLNTFNATLIGTLILLENLKKYSPHSKMFQASSSAMFGNNIEKDGFQKETTSFNPISPYASSKLFAHNICTNYRQNEKLYINNGILYNHESLKFKMLFGIVNTIVQKAIDIKNNKLSNFYIPNLNTNIDLGHAKDYVEAMWLTLQQPHPEDYIIASGRTYSIEYMCDYVFSKLELNYKDYIKTEIDTPKIQEIKGDISKLNLLGWKPKYSFEDIMDELINYYNK